MLFFLKKEKQKGTAKTRNRVPGSGDIHPFPRALTGEENGKTASEKEKTKPVYIMNLIRRHEKSAWNKGFHVLSVPIERYTPFLPIVRES